MDSIDALLEEKKLLMEAKYRTYMTNIDKALRNFEYSSEWADLISALGKLSKAISSNTHYQVIPRRIKISKRLAQCMHPALPSGVHLKALETYAVIFSKTGPERLATELFIYSAGLFPLLGYAAMNVRPALLGIYEKYFVPLGDKLRPALSGFLSGVLPGYESGLDHFERTNALLTQICNAVAPKHFYTVLWECVATNAVIRLPAITYLLEHINKRVEMEKQLYIMGHNTDNMISALCACLNDSLILVQRNTLEFLLIGFPMHTPFLNENELVSLVTNSLNTILRRDMSLNRRLYSWLLGSEIIKNSSFDNVSMDTSDVNGSYFLKHSKDILIKAIVCTLKLSLESSPVDLRPYRIMISLLDKAEIGSAILDFVFCDIVRTMALSSSNIEVVKSANLLFASFEPAYIWCFITSIFEKTCKKKSNEISFPNTEQNFVHSGIDNKFLCRVGSGDPSLLELCYLTEFLLETISLEMYNETTRVFLPKVLLAIIKMITMYIDLVNNEEVMGSLKLCMRIVSRVQPMITSPTKQLPCMEKINEEYTSTKKFESLIEPISSHMLEKSKSDSKLNQTGNDIQTVISMEAQEETQNPNSIKAFAKNDQRKKKSKSYSKLFELDKELGNEENNLPSAKHFSTTIDGRRSIKKVKTKGRSQYRLNQKKNSSYKCNGEIEDCSNSISGNSDLNDLMLLKTDNDNIAVSDYSILEKCIRQYEEFFEIYLAREIFHEDFTNNVQNEKFKCDNGVTSSNIYSCENIFMDETVFHRDCQFENAIIDDLFDTLKIDTDSPSKKLETLLCLTMGNFKKDVTNETEKTGLYTSDYKLTTRTNLEKVIDLRLDKFKKTTLKMASNLLVEMSTFPNCNRNVMLESNAENIPYWLKLLAIIGCYVKNDMELQLLSITTLFDLISLLKSQTGHTTSPGVSLVVMLPLLKSCHITYLEKKTRTFQILTSNLWSYLGEFEVDSDQITLLLYQIHNCLESGLIETIIAKTFNEHHITCCPISCSISPINDRDNALKAFRQEQLTKEHLVCTFPTLDWPQKSNLTTFYSADSKNLKKFEIIWHLGRDKQSQKSFESTLLKVLDRLCLPHYMPDFTFVSSWVQTSLLRGDLPRLLKPLYKILLCSNSKRVSITHLQNNLKSGDDTFSVIDDNDDMSEGLDAAFEHDICAISSEHGSIKYHIDTYGTKKHSPIRNFQKKVFGVALSNKNKTSNFVSNSTTALNHSIELAHDCTKIGVIVNPLQSSPDFLNEKNCGNASKSEPNIVVQLNDDSETSTLESDSEKKDNSTETEQSLISGFSSTPSGICSVKRFVGDCEVVTERLSQHDRIKNRKTYHLIRENNQEDKNETAGTEKIEQDNSMLLNIQNHIGQFDSKLTEKLNANLAEKLHDRSKKSKSPDFVEKDEKTIIDQFNISTESVEMKIDETSINEVLTINAEDKRRILTLETTKHISEWELNDDIIEKSKENVQILRQNNVGQNSIGSKRSSTKSSNSGLGNNNNLQIDTPHFVHSQILVYLSIYDTKQVLYAFQTLRNIISCDSRTFLCLSITSSINSSSLKQLLNRHRRSISGKGFEGNISNSDYSQNYRGCMHIEVLITLCLYYSCSYFYKCVNENSAKLPKEEDIVGNSRVQLESFELLTFICHELINIVRGMGKSLACYIGDLMARCKIQKVILNCLVSSVQSFGQNTCDNIYSEKILIFNSPKEETLFAESFQIQILKCLTEVIKLEHEVNLLRTENGVGSTSINSKELSSTFYPYPLSASDLEITNLTYEVNKIISQQPLFLFSVLNALKKDSLRHVHRNWTDLIISCLNCFSSGSLKNVVISVVYQLCNNIETINKQTGHGQRSFYTDYVISQIEAVTILCHYCLLDNTQQTTLSHLFNQVCPQTSVVSNSSNTGQLLNNIVNSFLSTNAGSMQTDTNLNRNPELQVARNSVLKHLPRIIATIAEVFENNLGQLRQVKQQLMEFLSPISLHHGTYFLASISITWHERSEQHRIRTNTNSRNVITIHDQFIKNSTLQICPEQQNLVNLLATIRVMPMDSLIHTLHHVVKMPPPIHKKNEKQNIELSCLELFYFYMKSAPAPQIGDSWSALLALLREGPTLSAPAQFVLLMILNDFVQRSPQIPFHDKKDVRDLHDVTSRLVESLSNIAGACLEQTTWLRRNLAVKEDISISQIAGGIKDNSNNSGIQQYSLQAQSVLASVVANLLDVTYGSQEKEKVTAIVTTLLYNVTPYLKNHTTRNVPSFYACSILLCSFSSYQYTRKSWRKEILELLLDNAFFQMDISCLPFWKQIMDSLMTYDNTTFRELMNRVSLTQTGTLNIFTSRDQEYEQRSMLLKRLAFVIFCSEFDQYNKYMPEIQEQLVNSLRLLAMVPSVQAAVFLCFRVILLRMSADNVTSLWPIIIAEMVQVFLSMEQELKTEIEEPGQSSRLSTGAPDASSTNSSNTSLNSQAIHWRAIQLEACKLLEMGCVLPAIKLPHFQMYRWAFVGTEFDSPEDFKDNTDDVGDVTSNSHYVPHVRRIYRLMEKLYTPDIPNGNNQNSNSRLLITCQSISSLKELQFFFKSLCKNFSFPKNFNTDKEIAECLIEIETILSGDFLEKMSMSTQK